MLALQLRPLFVLTRPRIALLAFALVLIGAYFIFDVQRYLTIASLKEAQHWFDAMYVAHPIAVTLLFFITFVTLTALTLPGAAVMMLAAGASFGLLWGTIISTLASATGATLAMLATRYVFRDAVTQKYSHRMKAIDDGLAKDGLYYLIALRLAPIIPFFILNWLVGLTHVRVWPFFWTSVVGMVAATAAYVNAGTQLNQINSFESIFTFEIIASLVALALLPLLLRWYVRYFERRNATKNKR
jgi:uncharacterized membrane protein YdjX (TVP38/TMEM64 family)